MTERTLNSSPLRAAIGPFYAQKGQKIGACGGLTVSVSGLNAFLERVWAVGGCSAFSVPHRMITVIFFYFTGLYGDSVHPCTSPVRSNPLKRVDFQKSATNFLSFEFWG